MIIIGLGNKGLSYKNTYHNMGFDVVSKLAKELGVRFSHTECKAKTAVTNVNGKRVVLAKPETYMNLSGESVRELMGKYKETADGIIVIYDDIDIAIGTIRARNAGSAGTHNGMRNIVKELYTQDFKRVRIGTKTEQLAQKEVELVDFVLSKVDFDNKQILQGAIDEADDAILALIEGLDIQRVQEIANKR